MKDIKYFLSLINNLDKSIKDNILSMANSKFIIHIDRSKNIGEEVNKLLKDMEKDIPKTFGSSILYIIGEITDNIEQHSNYYNAYIFLKYDPKERLIEILILDDGLSIPFVFKKNSIDFSEDNESIKMAIEGTTTKKEDITRGFGLRTSKKIVETLKGSIQIISRKGFLEINGPKMHRKDLQIGIKGTLVYAKLEAPKKDLNIYPYLE